MQHQTDTNPIYQLENGDWIKYQGSVTGLSKLCIMGEFTSLNTDKVIEAYILELSCPVFRVIKQSGMRRFWYIFAEYKTLLALSKQLVVCELDYLLWPEEEHAAPKLMLFDMDSTFIEIEVIDELAKRHQVGDSVSKVTAAAMRGELDFTQSLISRVACLKGLSQDVIADIADNLPLSRGVKKLVKSAHRNHCQTAIVSGGFLPFVDKLKNELNLFQVHANQLEIAQQCLTGKLVGDIVDARAKAIFLRGLCAQLNILPSQAMAIGDGANDLLMMQAAGFNLAYRAKPAVQSQSSGRIDHTSLDWLIEAFDWI